MPQMATTSTQPIQRLPPHTLQQERTQASPKQNNQAALKEHFAQYVVLVLMTIKCVENRLYEFVGIFDNDTRLFNSRDFIEVNK